MSTRYVNDRAVCWRCARPLERPATEAEASWIASEAQIRWSTRKREGEGVHETAAGWSGIQLRVEGLDGVRVVALDGVEVGDDPEDTTRVCRGCVTGTDRWWPDSRPWLDGGTGSA